MSVLGDNVAEAFKTCNEQRERIASLTAERDQYKACCKRLKSSLELIYDKWENGTPCFESGEDGNCEDGSPLGNAFRLSFEEEQGILNLIVEKAEEYEQACANCGKPYRAHLLHDVARCRPEGDEKWFPKTVADAIVAARAKEKKTNG